MTRAEELVAQGWQKQATTDEPRLSEMTEMYAGIGFDVHLEPFHPGQEKGCDGCLAVFPDLYKTIYTRKRKEASLRRERSCTNS
jgi:hypothetical protein